MRGADAGGGGRRRAKNWLQHKSLHAFTYTRSRGEGGAGAKSAPQLMGQHPIFRVRSETARSKPSSSSRNDRSARVHSASAPRKCEHTRDRGAGMSKSARLRFATAPRICERSLSYVHTCASGRGRSWAENRLQHNSLHAFTHTRSRGGGGVGAKSAPQQMGPTPIFRVRFETARSKPSLSSGNGISARVRSAYVWTYPW